MLSLSLASHEASAQRRRGRGRGRTPPAQTNPTNTVSPENSQENLGSQGSTSPALQDPVAPPSTEPVVSEPVASEPTPDSTPRPAAIDAELGVRWYARFFDYHQDVYGELRGYSLPAAPQLAGAVQWYPGAHFTRGPGSWFGLVASGGLVVGVSSRDARDTNYATSALLFDVGLRVRIPVGAHEIALHGTYGQQHFAIENNGGGSPTSTDPGVPAVQYQTVRVGASARLSAGDRVAILLGASGMPLLSAGNIGQYFTRSTGAAVEAQLGVAIKLVSGLELRVLADGRRYFYAMNPMVGDRWVAGGALDHHISAGAALAFRH
ncbi:MAG: hypothetical protein Q8Q09_07395 [Deltaproteobacteria bacterium]|nr:hypothetical protein [Deltaproteobacteria bacterium]